MIRAENLTKRYGKHVAISDLNFEIEKGEIIGFLGPNGAGKTTTMNIITGYLSASEGSIEVDGLNVLEHPEEVKRKIGFMPENPPLYPEMTVNEYLKFAAEIKQVPKQNIKSDLKKILELVKITDVQKRIIKNLSKGYKQRVGLAQALLGNPQILILDEPTVGLDPKQIIEIRNLIVSLREDHTIVLSSHILPEVSAVCERVLIINDGVIVANDSPEHLSKRLAGTNRITLRLAATKDEVKNAVQNVPSVKDYRVENASESGCTDLMVEEGTDEDIRRDIFFAMSENKLPILLMRPMDMTLEDIFLRLTTREKEVTE